MKKFFRCQICGDIHYGLSKPDECPTCRSKDVYQDAKINEVREALQKLGGKKFGRCTICNDLHLGKYFPRICPTCNNENVYVEIDREEFDKITEV